ncbi:spermatogenesis-associated protein 48 [Melanotaenia boesemani]|uniref:spermatogenesis-associated protein 48 n=1 Tax=Melanotaenia boesemani TaxID=1250792 RepID=UPI001C04B2B1|nr:spermatogenesis-associated protein 48 [Melanotaenia boesemani]
MTTVLDPSTPFSAELYIIKRLNFSLCRAGGGHAGSLGLQPQTERVALAPSRCDVPLVDPCSGLLSAGAEVDLGIKGRPKFINFHHVASAFLSQRPNVSVSSQGSASPVKIQQQSQRATTKATTHDSLADKKALCQNAFSPDPRLWTDNSAAVQHFIYTSATQRSYEEVNWDAKLLRRLKPAETTLEKSADPVSQFSSSGRYNSSPQQWQSVGADWNKRQLRSRSDAKKPISFCSGSRRSGQIPLYTGTIGSEKMDNIDNMDEDFHPLTLKRSTIPPCTLSAHRTIIPGYTGKAVYANFAAAADTTLLG